MRRNKGVGGWFSIRIGIFYKNSRRSLYLLSYTLSSFRNSSGLSVKNNWMNGWLYHRKEAPSIHENLFLTYKWFVMGQHLAATSALAHLCTFIFIFTSQFSTLSCISSILMHRLHNPEPSDNGCRSHSLHNSENKTWFVSDFMVLVATLLIFIVIIFLLDSFSCAFHFGCTEGTFFLSPESSPLVDRDLLFYFAPSSMTGNSRCRLCNLAVSLNLDLQ